MYYEQWLDKIYVFCNIEIKIFEKNQIQVVVWNVKRYKKLTDWLPQMTDKLTECLSNFNIEFLKLVLRRRKKEWLLMEEKKII